MLVRVCNSLNGTRDTINFKCHFLAFTGSFLEDRSFVDNDEQYPCLVRDGIPIVVKGGMLSDNWRL